MLAMSTDASHSLDNVSEPVSICSAESLTRLGVNLGREKLCFRLLLWNFSVRVWERTSLIKWTFCLVLSFELQVLYLMHRCQMKYPGGHDFSLYITRISMKHTLYARGRCSGQMFCKARKKWLCGLIFQSAGIFLDDRSILSSWKKSQIDCWRGIPVIVLVILHGSSSYVWQWIILP
jgi:hypothetical protein